MLRALALPGTLPRVLVPFRPCFTRPTFETFTALVAGLVARTVCAMLTGAGLAQLVHHGRAHRFFSVARWCPHEVGLVLGGLVVAGLPPAGATLAVKGVSGPNPTWPGTWWTPWPNASPTARSTSWATPPTAAALSPGWATT